MPPCRQSPEQLATQWLVLPSVTATVAALASPTRAPCTQVTPHTPPLPAPASPLPAPLTPCRHNRRQQHGGRLQVLQVVATPDGNQQLHRRGHAEPRRVDGGRKKVGHVQERVGGGTKLVEQPARRGRPRRARAGAEALNLPLYMILVAVGRLHLHIQQMT